MNLRRHLQKRTFRAAFLTALGLLLALAAWTLHDTRREIEATRELVRATVQTLQAVREGAETGSGGATGDEALAARPLRHAVLSLEPPGTSPASSADWIDRLFGLQSEVLSLEGLAPSEEGRPLPVLRIGGNARSELAEKLEFALAAFAGFAVLTAAVVLVQYRTLLKAFAPVESLTRALGDFERGRWSTRIPEPELDELARIARAFNALAGSLQQTVEEQQRLSQELLSLRARERGTLARELHDGLGQTITALSVNLALARQSLAMTGSSAPLAALERDVEVLQASTRELLADLRDDRAAEGFLRLDPGVLVRQWQADRPEVQWTESEDWLGILEDLPLPRYEVASRVLQESLTNAFRHARPGHLFLRVEWRDDGAVGVSLENDGVLAQPVHGGSGLGLSGMRERAESVGGSLQAGPVPAGWRVDLWFPPEAPGV